MKVKLKIHELYQDDIYWQKISALSTVVERKPLERIRHDLAIPKRKETLQRVVDFHQIIEGDDRPYAQVLVDLLSPSNS